MSNQWFRLYHEFATDPKVQMLSEANQRRFIMLLCLKCSNSDVTLHDEEIAFQLRISNEEWLQTKAILQAKNLIDSESKPTAWDKRQFMSDSSAARVARHRERKKKQCNVTVTPPDTDTDTDTDTDKPSSDGLPEKTDDPKKEKKKSEIEILLEAFGVNGQLATDFIKHRKHCGKDGKAAPITQTCLEGFQREAGKAGIEITEAVRISIERNWQGFRSSWNWQDDEQKSLGDRTSQNQGFSKTNGGNSTASKVINGNFSEKDYGESVIRLPGFKG